MAVLLKRYIRCRFFGFSENFYGYILEIRKEIRKDRRQEDIDIFSEFPRCDIWTGYALGSDKQVIGIIKQKKENGKKKLLMKFTLILNSLTCLFTKV